MQKKVSTTGRPTGPHMHRGRNRRHYYLECFETGRPSLRPVVHFCDRSYDRSLKLNFRDKTLWTLLGPFETGRPKLRPVVQPLRPVVRPVACVRFRIRKLLFSAPIFSALRKFYAVSRSFRSCGASIL